MGEEAPGYRARATAVSSTWKLLAGRALRLRSHGTLRRGKGGERLQFCQTFQETRDIRPRKQGCVGASPTCDPCAPAPLPLGLQPPSLHTAHLYPQPTACPPPPPGTSLPGSLSSHTHQNSVCRGSFFVYFQILQACHQPNTTKPSQGGRGSRLRLPPAWGSRFRP